MTEFKIGADPEFFLLDTTTGKHVSAFNMIPGTKAEPFAVDGGAVQVDGMALEFNIDPATTLGEFNGNINKVLRQLREMVPERYAFDFVPVAQFGQEYIDAQPEAAKELGCDPDFSAWTGGINSKPDGSRGIRTASGHVHIGWAEGQDVTHPDHIEACQMMSKQLDFYLGIPSLMWDTDRVRRTMYGDWGCYRPKHYGVEYRTLSNAWVNDEGLRTVVFANAQYAAINLMQGIQSYKRGNRPEYFDTQYMTNKQIWNFLNEYVPMMRESYEVLEKRFRRDEATRLAAVEWLEKSAGHYFWHNVTYEQRHYNDVAMGEFAAGAGHWLTNSSKMMTAKMANASYEQFVDSLKPKPMPAPSASTPWDITAAQYYAQAASNLPIRKKRKLSTQTQALNINFDGF